MAESFFGKTSDAILATSGKGLGERNPALRLQIQAQTSELWAHAKSVVILRAFIHLPLWPVYWLIFWVGAFGFYGARVPPHVFTAVAANMKTIGFKEAEPARRHSWFKTLEAYVMNCLPSATARMYNYLIISGLFRSMAFIFLAAIWAELWASAVDRPITGRPHIARMMTNTNTWAAELWGLVILYVIYVFSFWSYLKFQRRYVEEAIFAFGITEPERLSGGAGNRAHRAPNSVGASPKG